MDSKIIKLSDRNNKVLENRLKLQLPVTVIRKPNQPRINRLNVGAYLSV